MSRGRKAKTISNGATWEEIFDKSQGFYFQYIISELGKRNKQLTNENANDLLEAIKIEKEKLLIEKKIKQGKLQDSAIQNNILFEIPNNWVWCKLDDISKNITDGTHQTPSYIGSGRPFISATHVKPFRFIPENYKFVSEKAYQEYIVNRKAEIGDILVTRVGAIGEAAVIDVDLEFAFYVSVGLIQPFKDYVFSEFIAYVINSPYGNLYSKGNVSSKGSSAGNFNLGRIRSFLIPLPPRSEQELILNFLNDFGKNELDESREYFDSEIEKEVLSIHQTQIYNNQITTELSHQLELVRQLRQAFLREAMQGKLVPQDTADEPAVSLLEKIKGEKEKLIAEKKIKKDKPLPEIKPEEIPFEIPKNWTWCRFPEIAGNLKNALKAGPFGSSLKKEFYVSKGYKIYGQEQVIKQNPFWGDYYINEKRFEQLSSCEVRPGDILISLVGTMGKVLILPENIEKGIINPRLVKLTLYREINREFIKSYLYSVVAIEQINHYSHGSTMNIINLGIINKLLIPLPPLAEQKRIVEKLEKLMKFCDELEANIRESKGQAESLLQVALKEALEPK